jgi:hypothetical protein
MYYDKSQKIQPKEAEPRGHASTLEYLRVWGCKAYVLKPKGWQVYLTASEVDEAVSIFMGVEAKLVSCCVHLIESHHDDDEYSLLCATRKGFLVGYKTQITSGRDPIEDSTPIHIAGIKRMTVATTLMTN